MSPHDEQRFAKLINDFVDGCKFARPFHLVVIDARGSVSVARYDRRDDSREHSDHGEAADAVEAHWRQHIQRAGCGRWG